MKVLRCLALAVALLGCGPNVSCLEPDGLTAANCPDSAAFCLRQGCTGIFDPECSPEDYMTARCFDNVVDDCPEGFRLTCGR